MNSKSYMPYGLTCLIIFFMTCLLPDVVGQTVAYEYDAAGNRILRTKTITLTREGGSMLKSSTGDGGQNTENATEQALAEVRYDDLLGERKVTIYPNPTQGMIRIEFQEYGEMKDARLLLYDVRGKLLRQVNKVNPSNTLDLSSYPVGMYVLQMIEGKTKSEWKIIKE